MVELERDKAAIVKRLKIICDSLFGGRPTEFAHALDMTYENLHQYMTGRNAPGNKFQARLRRIGVDPSWVLYGTGKPPFKHHPDIALMTTTSEESKEKAFRVHESVPTSAAAFGSTTDRYQPFVMEDYSSIDHVFLRLNRSMVEGMQPLVNPGDLALIARRTDLKDGDLVAARWTDDDGAVRIYHRLDDKIHLTTISPTAPPLLLGPKNVQIFKIVLLRKA
jgi:SOS-response transcriptional repressor LexA